MLTIKTTLALKDVLMSEQSASGANLKPCLEALVMEVTFGLIDTLFVMPYRSSKDYTSVQSIHSNSLSAVLLAALPNRTILGPSEPKTCPQCRLQESSP